MRKFLSEYWDFVKSHKKWFLIPLAVILLFFAATFFLTGTDLPVYFLYALF